MRLHFTRILHIHVYMVLNFTRKEYHGLSSILGGDRMKHPKLWDGISSVLVLFGLGLYGSSCYYGIYVALGCIVLGAVIAVRTQRCPFCHRYLGMMFFTGKKTYCPHCGSDVRAGRNV
jgi:hypothetical protein